MLSMKNDEQLTIWHNKMHFDHIDSTLTLQRPLSDTYSQSARAYMHKTLQDNVNVNSTYEHMFASRK